MIIGAFFALQTFGRYSWCRNRLARESIVWQVTNILRNELLRSDIDIAKIMSLRSD